MKGTTVSFSDICHWTSRINSDNCLVVERVADCVLLCVLAFQCLHGLAPSYLSQTFHLSTEVDARRRLRSASTSTLIVPSTRRSTLGDRAFPVAAARAWNSLPPSVRSTSSLASFCLHLKTHLFAASFPR